MAEKRLMGEILVELGLIDEHRLRHALEIAKKKHRKLGETLIRLAYLSEDQVLGILKNLAGVPAIDMKNGVIGKAAQTVLPPDRMRELKVIPMEIRDRQAVVAFADPLNYVAVENVKFLLNRDVVPVLASEAQVEDILEHLERTGYGKKNLSLSSVKRSISSITIEEMSPSNILRLLDDPESTDLHLSLGTAPAVRTGGIFKRCRMPIVTPGIMKDFLREVMREEERRELEEKKEVEFTYLRPGVGRYRINMYYQKGGEVTVAVKKLVEDIPSLASLGLPDSLTAQLGKKGLLVVSSARGQGKDTTIAALVDRINSTRCCNIITFEDPIEYIHHHKSSNVNQRELGKDTGRDFSEIFDRVNNHDPDVLVISDIKDAFMVETAILAAQKGILVIIGLNAVDVFSAIEQLISTLSDDYMKALFSRSLLAAFAQRLIWSRSSKKRMLIWEHLLGTPRVQKFIRDDKIYYIKGQATSLKGEYFPMEESLARAIRNGLLTGDAVLEEPWINQDVLRIYLER
ncbi:MAG: Twitching mobility protein [Deltaproteobacteria bacterium ADurb.BinA179]|jgi:twitching motility protein PilT|nr:Flp pilus assembly complex ATPase component TadA [Deltaproteobacteria bacterium]MDI9544057.1 ATPase, T2SS/T4P/T4SS family [Pseudomonadota bacterium]OPZ27119.1 MAG: Twitching mobility protein [Deltaproteobacteria bacterium ADurb.BinA179]HNU74838.1 ATPase, T2SS/T4P/T4SS family [Deltaproteobacteria bacterium]HOD71353.1 ATPase, T2SS/T4P/T4SS family [Deltaproteobacteria bacterium]